MLFFQLLIFVCKASGSVIIVCSSICQSINSAYKMVILGAKELSNLKANRVTARGIEHDFGRFVHFGQHLLSVQEYAALIY